MMQTEQDALRAMAQRWRQRPQLELARLMAQQQPMTFEQRQIEFQRNLQNYRRPEDQCADELESFLDTLPKGEQS